MAKCNHCYILKGNNIKTNNEQISMTFFLKKVIIQNQSKEKTKQNNSKKKQHEL